MVGGVARPAPACPTPPEAIHRLEQIYCGTTGYEFAHVEDPDERAWLLDAIEEERFRPPNDPVDERELLDRLTEVSAFERFLHRAYPGQTRFSVEGLGMLIPMLDELIADAAAQRHAHRSCSGMAHRGRLNVLAHVLGKPYAQHPGRVRGPRPRARVRAATDSTDDGWAGDVKYHAGARRVIGAERATAPVDAGHRGHGAEPEPPGVRQPGRAGHGPRRRRGPPPPGPAAAGRSDVARPC